MVRQPFQLFVTLPVMILLLVSIRVSAQKVSQTRPRTTATPQKVSQKPARTNSSDDSIELNSIDENANVILPYWTLKNKTNEEVTIYFGPYADKNGKFDWYSLTLDPGESYTFLSDNMKNTIRVSTDDANYIIYKTKLHRNYNISIDNDRTVLKY